MSGLPGTWTRLWSASQGPLPHASLRQPHDRKRHCAISYNAAAVTSTARVFRPQPATWNDVPEVAIAGFEAHLSLEHKDPHANGRRMRLADPPGRQVKKPALRRRLQWGNTERERWRRKLLRCHRDGERFESGAAGTIGNERGKGKFVHYGTLLWHLSCIATMQPWERQHTSCRFALEIVWNLVCVCFDVPRLRGDTPTAVLANQHGGVDLAING